MSARRPGRYLLRLFPAELTRMWPISTRVNSSKNDDADLLTPVPPDSSNTAEQAPAAENGPRWNRGADRCVSD